MKEQYFAYYIPWMKETRYLVKFLDSDFFYQFGTLYGEKEQVWASPADLYEVSKQSVMPHCSPKDEKTSIVAITKSKVPIKFQNFIKRTTFVYNLDEGSTLFFNNQIHTIDDKKHTIKETIKELKLILSLSNRQKEQFKETGTEINFLGESYYINKNKNEYILEAYSCEKNFSIKDIRFINKNINWHLTS